MAAGQGRGVVLGYLRYVLGFDSIELEEGLDASAAKMKAAQRSMQKTADGFAAIGKRMSTYVTIPVAGAAAAILKMGGDFESSMNKVGISTNGTAAELKAMNDLALQLGKDTVFGASDAADAMDMLAKNGLSAKQILEGAAGAAVNLAAAAGSELSPAANAITDVMAQFKLTTDQLPDAVNQITGAVNQSKLDFTDFAGAIAQAGGVAGGVGVNFKDFNAVIAATSSLFASGSDAGTSFKTFLTALPGNSKQATEAIKQYGLQFYDAQGNLRSMAAIAEELRTKLGGLNQEAKSNVLKTIFGTDAMRTAIGLMDQGAAGIDKVKAKIAETDAAAQSAQRLKGFNGQMEQLKGATESLAITIAQSGVLEFVTNLVEGLGGIVDRLAETNPAILKWGSVLAGIGAGMGPVVIALGAVVSGFSKLMPVLSKIGPAFSKLSPYIVTLGRALWGLAVAGGPLTLIAAAAAAVYIAWQNWDKIEPIVRRLYMGVKTWLMDKLKPVFDWVSKAIGWVADRFKWLDDVVVRHSYIPDMVDSIGDHMRRLQAEMVAPAEKTTKTTAERFRDMAGKISGIMDSLYPETAALRAELENLAALEADPKTPIEAIAAQRQRVSETADRARAEKTPGPVQQASGALDEAYAGLAKVGEAAAERLKAANDNAADSFVSMANTSLNALSNFASAVKSGGFLDVISTAFNAFGAIAGTGLFGGKIKTGFADFQPISGFRANGGPVSAGRSYVVGERGPELFTASRSGYVHANGSDAGSRRSMHFDLRGAVMTQDLLAQMNAMADGAALRGAMGGSAMAQSGVARRARRRIA